MDIIEKKDCCGCTACFSSCPTGAISMIPDREGFFYPEIQKSKCIDCGLCFKICKDVNYYNEQQKIYACWDNNDDNRAISSSGGIFSALARKVLKNGGYVCAVGYADDKKECLHKIINNESDLDDLRRAKFVQSKKYDIYDRTKQILQKGNTLLFCGTPCEVGGLRQYLRIEYDNLITCDLICGCVSSPKVYKIYIEYLNNKYKSNVVSVNFKDKRNGWRGKVIAVKFENGQEYYNSILDDDYCVSFHSRYNIRPSCFNCKYRDLRKVSDITLGDFWGIEKYVPEYDDNKGTSFILVNTHKGQEYLNSLEDIISHPMDIDYKEYATLYNWCLYKNPTGMPIEDRKQFYKDVESMSFEKMSEKDLSRIKEERKRKKLGVE